MKRQKHYFLRLLTLVCFVLLAGIISGKAKVQAASEYERLFEGDIDPDDPVKHGKYYFKYSGKDDNIYISKKKKSGYKKIPVEYGAFVNGKQAYYVREGKLYKYVFSTGKEVKLKSLSQKNYASWYISTVYGGKLYLTRSCFDEWNVSTYTYNTKTKKFKKVQKNCEIINRYGKYVVSQDEFRSDVSPYRITLWKLTSSGLKKIKKLTSRGFNTVFIDGKLYYTSYAEDLMKKVTLYRCNIDGTQKEKLAIFETEDEYGMVIIEAIRADRCTVGMPDGDYEYIYETKEMKKIE